MVLTEEKVILIHYEERCSTTNISNNLVSMWTTRWPNWTRFPSL
jgi:hypothetical protein